MAFGGEALRAFFQSVRETVAKAVEDAGGKAGDWIDETAQNVNDSVARHSNAENATVDAIRAISGDTPPGLADSASAEVAGAGGPGRIAPLLNGADGAGEGLLRPVSEGEDVRAAIANADKWFEADPAIAMGTRRGYNARISPESKIPAAPKIPGDVVLDTGDHVYYRPGSTAIGYDRNTQLNFDHVAGRDGYHDVVVHGNSKGYFMPGRVNAAGVGFPPGEVSPTHIVEAIRNSPHYHGGAVRLISCHSGGVRDGLDEVPAAQQVANELGVPVMAPTDEIGILPNRPPGQEPIIFNGGYWRIFLPLAR